MSHPRAKEVFDDRSVYHLITNRTCGGRMLFKTPEKQQLKDLLFEGQNRLCYEVIDYVFMDNHFHICIKIPPMEDISKEELLKRFRLYKDNEKMYFLTSVQNGYSDARCGYMVEFLFILDINYSSEDWAVLLSELPSSYKSFTTSNDYTFDLDIFKESGVFNISKNDGTYDDYDVYVGDYNDCEEYANKIEEEEKEEA